MSAPTGKQYVIASGRYRAVLTEAGAALRELTYDGRPLVEGFAEDAMPGGGSGQLLVPWPNRIRDGRYEFAGRSLQLPLTEPSRSNASHGLVRWAAWSVAAHEPDRIELSCFLAAQTGYPWALDLRVSYTLGDDGLHVTQAATNLADSPAPYASGAHPYLMAGVGPCDGWELQLPANTRLLTDDERLLPVGREDVTGTDADFRTPRRIGTTVVNHAFTDLDRDGRGTATTTVVGHGGAVALWVDEHHRWLQVYTGDETRTPRSSLAVEPMTAPPDAFNSGEDLVVLEPGERFAASWGIRSL
ncbi:aldose 1-epimerase family protein [Nocardioides sp. SYSU DS0651]|uniref:aldose 1-epimerase family protein n=1 Tax=Nocardioides sp. SYSU DS0651 TaxID=3415955 RepID=UPI003F4B869D